MTHPTIPSSGSAGAVDCIWPECGCPGLTGCRAHPPAAGAAREASELPGTPAHSLGGFRGGFYGIHGRQPTDQEIWNAAIRSWRDLNERREAAPSDAAEVLAQKVERLMSIGCQSAVAEGPHRSEWLDLVEQTREAIARARSIVSSAPAPAGRVPLTEDEVLAVFRTVFFDKGILNDYERRYALALQEAAARKWGHGIVTQGSLSGSEGEKEVPHG